MGELFSLDYNEDCKLVGINCYIIDPDVCEGRGKIFARFVGIDSEGYYEFTFELSYSPISGYSTNTPNNYILSANIGSSDEWDDSLSLNTILGDPSPCSPDYNGGWDNLY